MRRRRVDERLQRIERARRARRRAHEAGRIVISTFEHPAITDARRAARRRRPRGRRGRARARRRARSRRGRRTRAKGAGVVALIMVQNEIGVVQPIARDRAPRFARVAPDRLPHPRRRRAGARQGRARRRLARRVDSISIAGHKLHGPKGTGALWLRSRRDRSSRCGSAAASRRVCAAARKTRPVPQASGSPPNAPSRALATARTTLARARRARVDDASSNARRDVPPARARSSAARRTSSRSASPAFRRARCARAREPRRLHLDGLGVRRRRQQSRRRCSKRSACRRITAWCGCRSRSTRRPTTSTPRRRSSPTSRSSSQEVSRLCTFANASEMRNVPPARLAELPALDARDQALTERVVGVLRQPTSLTAPSLPTVSVTSIFLMSAISKPSAPFCARM